MIYCSVYNILLLRLQMHLRIKTLKGETFELDIDASATFYDLKNLIQQVKAVPVELQKIVYKGKAMENEHILGEIGVREDDILVMMKIVQKKNKNDEHKCTVEKDTKKEETDKKSSKDYKHIQDPNLQQKLAQLEALGYPREKSQLVLANADGNVEKALVALTTEDSPGNQEVSNLIRQQIFKALKQNQELLAGQNGEGHLGMDLQSLANSLGDKNEQLKKVLLQNPEALGQLLFDNLEELGEEFSQGSSPEMHQVELTQAEEQSIQKLVDLGFDREDVIEVYFACDKNEDMAANMLFDRQANGDYDDLA